MFTMMNGTDKPYLMYYYLRHNVYNWTTSAYNIICTSGQTLSTTVLLLLFTVQNYQCCYCCLQYRTTSVVIVVYSTELPVLLLLFTVQYYQCCYCCLQYRTTSVPTAVRSLLRSDSYETTCVTMVSKQEPVLSATRRRFIHMYLSRGIRIHKGPSKS